MNLPTVVAGGVSSQAGLASIRVMRCPGCDCEPVGYAPHNGRGDCQVSVDTETPTPDGVV